MTFVSDMIGKAPKKMDTEEVLQLSEKAYEDVVAERLKFNQDVKAQAVEKFDKIKLTQFVELLKQKWP